MSRSQPPALLFVVGASGAGKSAAVRALEARGMPGVRCYGFDSIGVPTREVLEREWGNGENWQEQMTKRWIERLAANTDAVQLAVLEGQTRPSFIQPRLAPVGIGHARILLFDCTPTVRMARLRGPREQPELAGDRMDAWAAYLRGQADALGLRVLNTSEMSIEGVADVLQEEIEALRGAAGAPDPHGGWQPCAGVRHRVVDRRPVRQLEGGCWQDGLQVQADLLRRADYGSVCMLGPVVEILSIRPR